MNSRNFLRSMLVALPVALALCGDSGTAQDKAAEPAQPSEKRELTPAAQGVHDFDAICSMVDWAGATKVRKS